MTFVTKAGTAISAFIVVGLISLGVPEVLPSSYATPISTEYFDQAPLANRLTVWKLSPHGPQLSREEAEAKQREKTGTKRAGDDRLIRKANDKIKTREKFQGTRNIARRENLKKIPPKVTKPRKRR